MPPLTRWMIKTSLVHLLLALVIGVAQGAAPWMADGLPVLRQLEPVRVHLLVVGWLTQLIFGVVIWMFPKYSREKPRGHEWLGWVTYVLLNLGLALRAAGEGAPNTLILNLVPSGWLLIVSALLQWLAALAFFLNTWPRVREK